jgi:hypothetical protein
MALFQSVVIGLLALIITPGYMFYFDMTPKVVVLLAGTAVALVGCGPTWLPQRGRSYRLFSLLLAVDGLSLAVSTALSANPALSAFGTNWRRFGSVVQAAILLFAWLVATHAAGRPERVRTILRGIAASGGISAVYGISQYFGWDPILPAAGYHIGEGIWTIVRPPGTLGYVSYFATWLLFVTFLSLALAAMDTSLWWRRAAFATAALSAVAMLLTGTRAAMLGLAAGLAVRWFVGQVGDLRRVGNPPAGVARDPRGVAGGPGDAARDPLAARPLRPPWLIPTAAALIALAAAGFYFSPPGRELRSRARWFVEDPWGGNRPALWRDSLRMAMARLPLGYGPEVFTGAFPRFESKALAEAYPDFLHESPHNIFLDGLISQGLPGLLILCGLCWVGLKTIGEAANPGRLAGGSSLQASNPPAVTERGRKPPERRLQPGLAAPHWMAAALAAGIVSQQFTVFTVPTAVIFFVTIALNVALASSPAEGPPGLPVRLAVAPVALAFLYLAVRFTISDHALALTRRSVEAGDLPSAVARYEQYQRWNLPGTTADLWYSRALLGLAQRTPDFTLRFQTIAQSGVAAVRATKAAEDPFNAWYNMAALYASQNDSARTERSLRSAVAANPNWFKPHWALAQLLRMEHRLEEAEAEAATAAELDAGRNPEVAATLSEVRAQRAHAGPSEHK